MFLSYNSLNLLSFSQFKITWQNTIFWLNPTVLFLFLHPHIWSASIMLMIQIFRDFQAVQNHTFPCPSLMCHSSRWLLYIFFLLKFPNLLPPPNFRGCPKLLFAGIISTSKKIPTSTCIYLSGSALHTLPF